MIIVKVLRARAGRARPNTRPPLPPPHTLLHLRSHGGHTNALTTLCPHIPTLPCWQTTPPALPLLLCSMTPALKKHCPFIAPLARRLRLHRIPRLLCALLFRALPALPSHHLSHFLYTFSSPRLNALGWLSSLPVFLHVSHSMDDISPIFQAGSRHDMAHIEASLSFNIRLWAC